MADDNFPGWHGTTIIGVKKGGKVVIAGDGQVSLGQTVIRDLPEKFASFHPEGTRLLQDLRALQLMPSPY